MKKSELDAMLNSIDEGERHEEEEEQEAVYVRPPAPRHPTQVYSVRVPVDRLDQLRTLAQKEGVSTSVLVRQLVIEGLDQRSGGHAQLRDAFERIAVLESEMDAMKKDHTVLEQTVVGSLESTIAMLNATLNDRTNQRGSTRPKCIA